MPESNEPAPGMTTRLSDSLIALGAQLPESHRPAAHTVNNLLAGLLYWLETGSVEPPVIKSGPAPTLTTNKDAEIAQLKAELAQAQSEVAPATPIPASPVTPSPQVYHHPVPGTPVTPGEEPAPAVPVPTVAEVPSAPAGS